MHDRNSSYSQRRAAVRRQLRVESLEPRRVLAGTNPENQFDVNADLVVSPHDVLLIINKLEQRSAEGEGPSGGPFWDVNRDGFVSPIDALMVIVNLNSRNPHVFTKLTTDTTENGGTNNDRITSDPSITGWIQNAKTKDQLFAAWDSVSDSDLKDITAYRNGANFQLTHQQIADLRGAPLTNGQHVLTIVLRRDGVQRHRLDYRFTLDGLPSGEGEGEGEASLIAINYRTENLDGQPLNPLAVPPESRFNLVVESKDLRNTPKGVYAIDAALDLNPASGFEIALGELQALRFSQAFSSGTFRLSFNGQTTAAIAAPKSLSDSTQLSATADAIKAALTPILGAGSFNVVVNDDLPLAEFIVQFGGYLSDVPALTGDFSQVPGTSVVDNYTPPLHVRSEVLRSMVVIGQGHFADDIRYADEDTIIVSAFSNLLGEVPNPGQATPMLKIPMRSKLSGSLTIAGTPGDAPGRENLLRSIDQRVPASAVVVSPLTLQVGNPITLLGTVQGVLQRSGLALPSGETADVFQFTTVATGRATHQASIHFAHGQGDLELELYDASENLLKRSSSVNNSETVSLQNLPAGTYRLRVYGFGGDTNPDYSLQINAPTLTIEPDRFEVNNSQATAADLTAVAGTISLDNLTLHQSSDEDWYRITLPTVGGATHFASVDFKHRDGDIDVELWDTSGNKLRESKTSRDREHLPLVGLPTGDYWVRVTSNGATTSPHYRFALDLPSAVPHADSFEPNDARASATDLRAVSGVKELLDLSIHSTGNDDWFRFETLASATTSHFLGLIFDRSQGDVDLQLFDHSGSLLATAATSNDWELINLANRPAGVYFARVYGYQNATSPRYSFTLVAPESQLAPDGYEVNNTPQLASDLRAISGRTVIESISIHNVNDVDWFAFTTLQTGGPDDFVAIEFSHTLGNLDFALTDRTGNVLRESTSTADIERISLTGLSAGNFLLRVRGADTAVVNPAYRMTIVAPPPATAADPYEPNDNRISAFDLKAIEGSANYDNGSLHQSGDEDWYRFEIKSGGQAGHFAEVSFNHSQGDVELDLLDANGQPLRVSHTANDVEQISLQGLTAGVYYLKVSGFGGATNRNYRIQIRAPFAGDLLPDRYEPNGSLATATELRNLDGKLAGSLEIDALSIHAATDVDHFRFTTVAEGTAAHSVSLVATDGGRNLKLELLDSAGNLLASSSHASAVEVVSLNGLPAAQYSLRISGNSGTRSPYQLSLDTPTAPGRLDAWTIMVYMTSSDLEEFAFSDVNELEEALATLPGSVNVALLWDQSENQQRYATGRGSQAAWGTAGRGFLQPDLDSASVATAFELLGELNTGSSATLTSFINWAAQEAPAERYALISWDHGAGIYGTNFDDSDSTAVDNLRISELAAAIAAAGIPKLDLLAFDACLMAMTEVGFMLQSATDILVGSQEVVGSDGYDYLTLFSNLAADPYQVSGDQLASNIVRSFAQAYAGDTSGWDTQSAIRTTALSAVAVALKAFSTAVASLSAPQLSAVATAFGNAVSYSDPNFRDLGGLMSAVLALNGMPATVRTAAEQVRAAIGQAIVARSQDARGSSGLSIFIPDGAQVGDFYSAEFAAFATASDWPVSVNRLGGLAGGAGTSGRFGRAMSIQDWAENNNLPAAAEPLYQLSGRGLRYSDLSLHEGSDVDWFRFSLAATGQSTDKVALLTSSTVQKSDVLVELFDVSGLNRLGSSAASTANEVSLKDLPAGEYLLRIASPTSVSLRNYTLQFDAPTANSAAVGRFGDISVREKAYPLGVVGNQLTLPGLQLAAGADNWFVLETPRLPDARWFQIQITAADGKPLTAEVIDQAGGIVSRDTGTTPILGYLASGGAERLQLRVRNLGTTVVAYQVRIFNFVDTLTDVSVSERLAGTLVGNLPLQGLVSAIGTVTVGDERFEWMGGGLRLRNGQHLVATSQSAIFVPIEVTDALSPGHSESFVLPIKINANTHPHHNAAAPFNVNNDFDATGKPLLTPVDALLVISALNSRGSFNPEFRAAGLGAATRFVDVNRDGKLTPLDVLLVISRLNARGGSGEGEPASVEGTVSSEQQATPFETAIVYPVPMELQESDTLKQLRRRGPTTTNGPARHRQ